jgi:ATP-dependent Clp protease ATP-binding subunit ClpB
LLQLLDDGRLTDGKGRTVDFRNTVVIMTSNIGSPLLLEGVSESGEIDERARTAVLDELRRAFRPEFLNRVDDVVLFSPLTRAEVEKIVEIQLEGLHKRLAERLITLELSPAARKFIAETAYDPVYGARPVKRFLQRHVETVLGRKLIAGEIADGGQVRIDVETTGESERELVFRTTNLEDSLGASEEAAPEASESGKRR